MKRPKDDEKRASLYVVTTEGHRAGLYIGETNSHVVLRVGDLAQGFRWDEVEPVQLKETTGPES